MLRAGFAQGLRGPHGVTLRLLVGLFQVGISARRKGKWGQEEIQGSVFRGGRDFIQHRVLEPCRGSGRL